MTDGPHPPALFLLSPANLTGVRGGRILGGTSGAPFMETLRAGGRVPLGDVYASVSSLYFRGKRAYADAFARPGPDGVGNLVITPDAGLLPVDEPVDLETLRRFAETDIAAGNETYAIPLLEDARRVDGTVGDRSSVGLLGSIASDKYLEPLAGVFGRRLLFPEPFIGRGDMSRGGLLLRAVEAGEELPYVVAVDAERRGERPPRLPPR
ncbi:MAG: hypothetical protein PVI57_19845 [Gemmatimonadota bacterium]